MTPLLLHLPYSPWSERARWSLDLRRVPYEKKTYQPLLGELGLRKRLGRWSGRVSVPVLFTEDGALSESVDIARFANAHGEGPDLFPRDANVDHWVRRSEDGMNAGRALSLTRVLAHPEALDELTPKFARPLGFVARAVTRGGVIRTRRKYDGHERTNADHAAALSGVLDEMRASLKSQPYLCGALTYADLCASQVIAFVEPPKKGLKLGPGNRKAYGDPELASRYGDLALWRDRLYEQHR